MTVFYEWRKRYKHLFIVSGIILLVSVLCAVTYIGLNLHLYAQNRGIQNIDVDEVRPKDNTFLEQLLAALPHCHANEFQCDDGVCISKSFVCDLDWDCSNAEDELNCPEKDVRITPSNYTGHPGDILAFACYNAVNKSAPITWKKLGQNELPSNIIVRDGILIIPELTVNDRGIYVCTSSLSTPDESYRMVTEYASVTIVPNDVPPTESTQEIFIPVSESSVQIDSNEVNLRLIVPSSNDSTINTDSNVIDGDLVLETYVEYKHSNALTKIFIQPQSQNQYEVARGATAKLICDVIHFDQKLSWRRQDGQPLPNSSFIQGDKLIIANVQNESTGIYECVLYGCDVPVNTTELVITALPKVEFNVKGPLVVRAGLNIKILCTATGPEPLSTNWHQPDYSPFPSNVWPSENTLKIYNISKKNSGLYSCTVFNANGNVTETVKIDVDTATEGEMCPFNHIHCYDGSCISRHEICDGEFDCPYNEDETFCDCALDEYKCANDICIDRTKLCDEHVDCNGGDDEDTILCL